MKNIWPVKTARCDRILHFIACQNVFYFVLRKSMTIFCEHAAIKIVDVLKNIKSNVKCNLSTTS